MLPSEFSAAYGAHTVTSTVYARPMEAAVAPSAAVPANAVAALGLPEEQLLEWRRNLTALAPLMTLLGVDSTSTGSTVSSATPTAPTTPATEPHTEGGWGSNDNGHAGRMWN